MATDQKVRLAGQVRLHSSRSFSQIGATRSSSCDVGMKAAGEGPCTYLPFGCICSFGNCLSTGVGNPAGSKNSLA